MWGETDTVEDALCRELEDQGLDLEALLFNYPKVRWRKQNPKDPNWSHGFTVET
jgi:hypothetical protein